MTLLEEYFSKLDKFIDECHDGETRLQKTWLFFNSLYDKKIIYYDEETKKEKPMNSTEIVGQILYLDSMSDIEKVAKEAIDVNPFDLEAWQYCILVCKEKKFAKLEMCHDVIDLAENMLVSLNIFNKKCFKDEKFEYLISAYLKIKELYIEQLINCDLYAEARYQAKQLYYQDVNKTINAKEYLIGLAIALKEYMDIEKLYQEDANHSLGEMFLYAVYLVENKNYLEAKMNLDNLFKLNHHFKELLCDFDNIEKKVNISNDGTIKKGSLEEAYAIIVDHQYLLPEIKHLADFAVEKETLIN